MKIALHQSRKRICFSTKMGFEQEQQKRYNRKHKCITWSTYSCCNLHRVTTLTGDDGGGVGVYGDPHITALDGSHYLLLSQGTFSLWHLHGLLTEFQTQDGFKKVPVEWEIFTRYSGHQSFTKGLLLIDRSAGVQRQVLEITSQDCQWRAHSGAEWTMVSKPGMISVAEGQDYVTGFNMTKTNGRKHRGGHASRNQLNLNQVHLSMNSKDGATDIAVLAVSCRPKRNLNLNLVMKRRLGGSRFVLLK